VVSVTDPYGRILGLFQRIPRLKRQEREADHSPPTSAEIMKTWIYTSTPPYSLMAWCLVKRLLSHGILRLVEYASSVA
jgi:hypothetical protein